jgi:hypothetical protein
MRWRKSYTRKGTHIRSQTRKLESSKQFQQKMRSRMTKRFRGVPFFRRTLQKCPKGFIVRGPYVRYSKKGKRTLVPAACVMDRGRTGKGTRSGPGIGPLRKGDLSKYGYMNVTHMEKVARHASLEKAIREYGPLSTWRKLNAVYVYTRNTAPESSRVFKADMDWIRKTFSMKAF